MIAAFTGVLDAWLRADLALKASVIHERLVAEYAFTGSYQRVKMYAATACPRIAAELETGEESHLGGLHRRFEVVAGARPRSTGPRRATCSRARNAEGLLLPHGAVVLPRPVHLLRHLDRPGDVL